MSDSVRLHRRQPTRLPRPWDSPGKNTGVGCHFLLQCVKVKSESEVAQSCPTLSDPMDCSLSGSSIHGIFPGKSTGVGCHCLLHGPLHLKKKKKKKAFQGLLSQRNDHTVTSCETALPGTRQRKSQWLQESADLTPFQPFMEY